MVAKWRQGRQSAMVVVLCALLTSCALGDVGTPSPLPPLTVAAPPALRFEGSCENIRTLETWLQITTRLISDFQTKMNEMASKSAKEIFEDTRYLASLRDAVFLAATPDCGQGAQLAMGDAMSRAVTAFHELYNLQRSDVTGIITEVNGQLDQVIQAQNELTQQMETRLRAPLTQTAPTDP